MNNSSQSSGANLALALPVPANTPKGVVLALGGGLRVLTLTDRATTANIALGYSAQGLLDGQASCRMIGVSDVVTLPTVGAIAQFAKVYLTNTGSYTATVGTNTFIGYALDALAADGTARVALTVA